MTQEEYVNPSYRKPDHPSFQDKKHTLLIDNQGASNRDIHTESGTLRLENGVAVLPDDTRAKDIYDEIVSEKALHPGQYSLIEDKPTVNVDPIHRYRFGYSRNFARRWDEIFGDTEEELDGKSTDSNTERGSGELQPEARGLRATGNTRTTV